MPGSGITGYNLFKIAKATGAFEFHTTAKMKIDNMPGNHVQNNLDERDVFQTDVVKVRKMCRILTDLTAEIIPLK